MQKLTSSAEKFSRAIMEKQKQDNIFYKKWVVDSLTGNQTNVGAGSQFHNINKLHTIDN